MKKVLISLTSYNENHIKFLNQVLSTYEKEYTDYDVSVILATRYPYQYSGSLNILYTRGSGDGHDYCWSNREYMLNNVGEFDYFISSDDDIEIPVKAFESVIQSKLPDGYIAGVVVYEQTYKNEKKLIHFNPFFRDETIIIDGNKYVSPGCSHSCCFIATKKQIKQANLSKIPTTNGRATIAEWERSEIYSTFKRVISYKSISDESALVRHLPGIYHIMIRTKSPTDFYQPDVVIKKEPIRGLGDLVYKVANPIAKAIDRMAGTNIQGCGGCKQRREFLNKTVPF